MGKVYLISHDNGYHYSTSMYFRSLEEAIAYRINELIEDLESWDAGKIENISVKIGYSNEGLQHPTYANIYECEATIIEDGSDNKQMIYAAEASIKKPTNRYCVKFNSL